MQGTEENFNNTNNNILNEKKKSHPETGDF